jgi:uncharacterized protein
MSGTVTAQLLKVFRVDQQLRGLKSRLSAAERFLSDQERQLKDVETRFHQINGELKALKSAIKGEEGETASIDSRVETLRERMNTSKTNKEYSALLGELNALKEKKAEIEKSELEQMGKIEQLSKRAEELGAARSERQTIITKARKDRDERAAEIKDRVDELSKQRAELCQGVEHDKLRILEEMITKKDDEAMSPVEVVDRRAHEWACTSCQMTLPVELVNRLSSGLFTRCSFCSVILFTEEDVVAKTKKRDAAENEDVVKSRKRVAKKAAENGTAKAE